MTALDSTAYPRLNAEPGLKELEGYTPSAADDAFVRKHAASAVARLGMLVHLQVHRRLGFFLPLKSVPPAIVSHLARTISLRKPGLSAALATYEASRQHHIHQQKIRDRLKVRVLDDEGRRWLRNVVAAAAAQTKHTIPNIINVMLEELVHHRYELPGFTTLDKIAIGAREVANEALYRSLSGLLTSDMRARIDGLFDTTAGELHSGWQGLKREPKQPTNPEMRNYVSHMRRMQELAESLPAFDVPAPKLKFFQDIARASNAAEMAEFKPQKRYALAMVFIRGQRASTLDYAADLFIRFVARMQAKARRKLDEHQLAHAKRADFLIGTLRDLLQAYQTDGDDWQRLKAVGAAARPDVAQLLAKCEEHMAFADKNYLPFLVGPYSSIRSMLFLCLEMMSLKSTSQDTAIERLITVLLTELRTPRRDFVSISQLGLNMTRDLDWLSKRWQAQIFSKQAKSAGPDMAHRKFLEIAVMVEVCNQLRSGDLCIPKAERYDDYRDQLVDDATLVAELPAFSEESGLPIQAKDFVDALRTRLIKSASQVDKRFAKNPFAEIAEGRLVLKKLQRTDTSAAIKELDRQISERLPPAKIVDVLLDVTRGLNLQKFFRPVSGTEPRVNELLQGVVSTIFCYGCNLGPTQTERSLQGLSRRQVAWLNIKYVTEDVLEQAIREVINAYSHYELPRYWGTGKTVSADGTQWSVYDGNLFSEMHIRYGGYGGIGYYHVSDTYIALFCRFITSGVHESVYLLDGLMKNTSEIQPDTVYGDTQSQSYPVFALAHLLGIKLMPRIRNIKEQVFFRPEAGTRYKHIDPLFGENIDWDLIAAHYEDMLRVMVSIKLDRLAPSAILRRLGTHSRKNKLYFAFRELGKATRTLYLLDYIDDSDVRRAVQAGTNKSEEWNGFVRWCFFANDGIIAENMRHEQVKVVKYGHLAANMVALYNVQAMTTVLQQLQAEGAELNSEMLAGLSPYRHSHINRLGDYRLDLSREAVALDSSQRILSVA